MLVLASTALGLRYLVGQAGNSMREAGPGSWQGLFGPLQCPNPLRPPKVWYAAAGADTCACESYHTSCLPHLRYSQLVRQLLRRYAVQTTAEGERVSLAMYIGPGSAYQISELANLIVQDCGRRLRQLRGAKLATQVLPPGQLACVAHAHQSRPAYIWKLQCPLGSALSDT